MEYCKLQLGCLIILLFIICVYIRESLSKKVSCNRIFDMLLIVAPQSIFFDGITAYTVNRLDVVSPKLNLILHAVFFLMMQCTMVLAYLYVLNSVHDLIRKRRMMILCLIPAVLTVVLTMVFLPQLEYIRGDLTNYSMGTSVVISYISLLLHLITLTVLLVTRRRYLKKNKLITIFLYIALTLSVLIIQAVFPQALVSALFPLLTVLGIYMGFENPSERRLQVYNADMVTGFATLVESRDHSTGGHVRRTKGYVQILLKRMSKDPRYRLDITRDYFENVSRAAPMHDIGKIATPDTILRKPGKLTDEEFDIMRQHSARGGEIIRITFADLDEPEFRQIAFEVARYHHEKWNGRGYPDGLAGEEIPLHARVMAIADVFDAVSAKRCYRDAMPIETCFEIIENGSGKDFDPALVRLFMESRDKILALYANENAIDISQEWI